MNDIQNHTLVLSGIGHETLSGEDPQENESFYKNANKSQLLKKMRDLAHELADSEEIGLDEHDLLKILESKAEILNR